jgi:hypothetical protein
VGPGASVASSEGESTCDGSEGSTDAAGASTFVLTPSVIVTSMRSKTLLANRRKILNVP